MIEKLFECVLCADESLVQAAWVEPSDLRGLPAVIALLQQGPSGRGLLGPYELQWLAEPGFAITTWRREGRIVLLSFAASDQQQDAIDAWLASLRAMRSIALLHGADSQAFAVLRALRERPLSGAVLFPEMSPAGAPALEAMKALLDLHRFVAFALLSARFAASPPPA